jgi:hypothetical protein
MAFDEAAPPRSRIADWQGLHQDCSQHLLRPQSKGIDKPTSPPEELIGEGDHPCIGSRLGANV